MKDPRGKEEEKLESLCNIAHLEVSDDTSNELEREEPQQSHH